MDRVFADDTLENLDLEGLTGLADEFSGLEHNLLARDVAPRGPHQVWRADITYRWTMSRKGNCWDNAPTESGFNSFKNERVFGERCATRDAMQATAFAYIEVFYNRKRLHATLGDTSPVPYLKDWIKPGEGEKQVA